MPDQTSPFRAALPAKPSLGLLGLAIAVKNLAALTTSSLPSALWHFGLSTPHGPGSNGHTLAFPHLIVAMPGSHQGVGNLVQQGVQDFFPLIAPDEVVGKLDGAATVNTQAQRAFAAVEAEGPVPQTMLSQQILSQGSDFDE